MKRAFVLFVALALALAGCSGKADPSAVSNAPKPETAAAAGNDEDMSNGKDAVDEARIIPSEEEDHASASAPAQNVTHGTIVKPPESDVIEIQERLFIAQTNDIYINPDDYLGKTIQYEGIYKKTLWEGLEQTDEIHYVIRYGPGCCGYDGEAGFEVLWDGGWPQEDDWVAVTGVLSKVEIGDGGYYLVLELNSLTVKEERGAEYVST